MLKKKQLSNKFPSNKPLGMHVHCTLVLLWWYCTLVKWSGGGVKNLWLFSTCIKAKLQNSLIASLNDNVLELHSSILCTLRTLVYNTSGTILKIKVTLMLLQHFMHLLVSTIVTHKSTSSHTNLNGKPKSWH